MPDTKVSRRQLAAALAAVVPALAQTAPPQGLTASAGDLAAAARGEIGRNSEALARTNVPIMLEPAFSFRA
jgi:hypothetical protein